MALAVLAGGLLTTIQDLGRFGFQRFGVAPSGAMDWFALSAANRLVGNEAGAAAIEFTLEGPELVAQRECVVAASGCGFDLWVAGRWVGLWMAARVRRGEIIQFGTRPEGGWGYMAVAGGVSVAPVLGSRATDLRAGFGGLEGRALRAGDVVTIGEPSIKLAGMVGRWLSPAARPAYGQPVMLAAVVGPQWTAFSEAGQQTFFQSSYQISTVSDRSGYRLKGATVGHNEHKELLSEGMITGAVQVPADGQPIVMMSDHPTTGGYPKIAAVTRGDLPRLAQCQPGVDSVSFQPVDVAAAQAAYRRMLVQMEHGISHGED